MSRTIDDIYTSIAQHLSACTNEDWGNILLEVEREADEDDQLIVLSTDVKDLQKGVKKLKNTG